MSLNDLINKKEFKDLFNIESYEQVMTLSVSLPKDEELNVALEDAGYTLVKRGGFIASTNYADAYHKKNVFVYDRGQGQVLNRNLQEISMMCRLEANILSIDMEYHSLWG